MSTDATQDIEPLVLVAARVSRIAAELGIKAVVIGGMALAHHGYARATEDVDLGTYTNFHTKLRLFAKRLVDEGFEVEEREPGEDDPIDGTLSVRDRNTPGIVQIVNFRTPPGRVAIANASMSNEAGDPFLYVRLAELVALKLYAGSPADKRDVEAVLEANPDADLDEIRDVCRQLNLDQEFEKILNRLIAD